MKNIEIESTFPAVLTNQAKLEELHDLRTVKKLRYLLELLPDDKNNVLKTKQTLQKLQDILGTIHDYDFTIEYLGSLGQSSTEIQEIITIEKEERNAKYHEFGILQETIRHFPGLIFDNDKESKIIT